MGDRHDRAFEFWDQVVFWAVSTIRPAYNVASPFVHSHHLFVHSARPEEVMWKVAKGAINASSGAPQDIVDSILAFNMAKPTDCTAYPEGSPTHPSWPAMHSAASSATLWMGVVLNLTQGQWCEVKRMDWGVGTLHDDSWLKI
jgi:hypothetical protein